MLSKNPRRKIIWQYWQNPFSGEDENEFADESEVDVKSAWEVKELEENRPKSFLVRPVVPTPMGLIPITPFKSFNSTFEFWMGHTNFDITRKIKDAIEATPGVEILDVFTRYCFRIAVGKAFIGGEVKHDIMRVVGAMPPQRGEINPHDMKLDEDTGEKVSLLKHAIREKFPYWAIYVLPNGEIDVFGSDTEDGFQTHLSLYKSAQDLAGGVIYQYG